MREAEEMGAWSNFTNRLWVPLPQWSFRRRFNAGDLGLIPGSGRSPEKEMANHFSILAWRIPWTEEPGGLQSMGSQ